MNNEIDGACMACVSSTVMPFHLALYTVLQIAFRDFYETRIDPFDCIYYMRNCNHIGFLVF